MKQLISLQQDYIMISSFVGKIDESGFTKWTDDEKKMQYGNNIVDAVYCLMDEHDRYGNYSNTIRKIYLSKQDILTLAENIKQTELLDVIGTETNELPF